MYNAKAIKITSVGVDNGILHVLKHVYCDVLFDPKPENGNCFYQAMCYQGGIVIDFERGAEGYLVRNVLNKYQNKMPVIFAKLEGDILTLVLMHGNLKAGEKAILISDGHAVVISQGEVTFDHEYIWPQNELDMEIKGFFSSLLKEVTGKEKLSEVTFSSIKDTQIGHFKKTYLDEDAPVKNFIKARQEEASQFWLNKPLEEVEEVSFKAVKEAWASKDFMPKYEDIFGNEERSFVETHIKNFKEAYVSDNAKIIKLKEEDLSFFDSQKGYFLNDTLPKLKEIKDSVLGSEEKSFLQTHKDNFIDFHTNTTGLLSEDENGFYCSLDFVRSQNAKVNEKMLEVKAQLEAEFDKEKAKLQKVVKNKILAELYEDEDIYLQEQLATEEVLNKYARKVPLPEDELIALCEQSDAPLVSVVDFVVANKEYSLFANLSAKGISFLDFQGHLQFLECLQKMPSDVIFTSSIEGLNNRIYGIGPKGYLISTCDLPYGGQVDILNDGADLQILEYGVKMFNDLF